MKKLYLIGDSIRMGYCEYVKKALEGKAEVYWPDENCRFAAYVMYAIGDWEHRQRIGKDCACVHFNAGLHDAVRLAGDEPVTPPDIYGYYLGRVCKKLNEYYPAAELIFATSTPVQEELYDIWLSRKNKDIIELNNVAKELVTQYGCKINDLYALFADCDKSLYSDKTHLNTPKAREIITKAVLKSVCPSLGLDFQSLEMPDFCTEIIAGEDILN